MDQIQEDHVLQTPNNQAAIAVTSITWINKDTRLQNHFKRS